jgi:hypothetical protein
MELKIKGNLEIVANDDQQKRHNKIKYKSFLSSPILWAVLT